MTTKQKHLTESGGDLDASSDNDAQYRETCADCGTMLAIDVHIFIMTRKDGGQGEHTICSNCRYNSRWRNWKDDQQ